MQTADGIPSDCSISPAIPLFCPAARQNLANFLPDRIGALSARQNLTYYLPDSIWRIIYRMPRHFPHPARITPVSCQNTTSSLRLTDFIQFPAGCPGIFPIQPELRLFPARTLPLSLRLTDFIQFSARISYRAVKRAFFSDFSVRVLEPERYLLYFGWPLKAGT